MQVKRCRTPDLATSLTWPIFVSILIASSGEMETRNNGTLTLIPSQQMQCHFSNTGSAGLHLIANDARVMCNIRRAAGGSARFISTKVYGNDNEISGFIF